MAVATASLKKTFPVEAPFLGLDEKQDPSALAPNRPRLLKNMLVHRKRMEMRPGFAPFDPPSKGEGSDPVPWQIQQVQVGKGDEQAWGQFIVTGDAEKCSIFAGGQGFGNAIALPETIGIETRGSIVVSDPYVYFLLPGASRPYRLRIDALGHTTAELVGIEPPTQAPAPAELSSIDSTDGLPLGVYAVGISLYDSEADAESNGTLINQGTYFHVEEPGIAGRVPILGIYFSPAKGGWPDAVTHVRVYMKIEEWADDPNGVYAGAEVGFRLVAEFAKADVRDVNIHGGTYAEVVLKASVLRIDPAGAEPPLGHRLAGPFLPTRNAPPPKSRYAVPYQNRMLWASEDQETAGLYYPSMLDHPGSVSPDDYIGMPDGSRARCTGMIEYQGRVIIFTELGIYVLAGSIVTKTNKNAALGDDTPDPTHQLFRTESDVGCINTRGGQGTIECDGILYFNGPEGIYRFDGLRSVKISHAIDDIWQGILDKARRSCTMANDLKNGILWICYAEPSQLAAYDQNVVLAYHYRQTDPETGFGAWTSHHFPLVCCVASWHNGTYIDGEPVRDGWFVVGTAQANAHSGERGSIGVVWEGGFGDGIRYDYSGQGDDTWVEIEGVYETGWLDLGLPSRAKRFHYLTLDVGNDDGTIPRLKVDVTVETLNGPETSTSFDLPESGTPRRVYKRRLDMRGTRLKLKFTGTKDLSHTQMRLNGFAVEAEPLGFR